jgi:dinuclear metal center YbgI/SA1388 family protein
MKLQALLDVLRALAPEELAEPWDKVGLHLGSEQQSVGRAMLCIDLTEPVLQEAVRQRMDLIVAYHPPIFQPLARLTDASANERVILGAARAGIAVYSPHTALDAAEAGINDWLASGLGAGQVRPIRSRPNGTAAADDYKLVTFVPAEAADGLRRALVAAGAGRIGRYTECSFSVAGEGTFRGDATTRPKVGRAGRFERAAELRMEMVLPGEHLAEAVAALRAAHPYEEPGFDVYPVVRVEGATAAAGQGRVVELKKPVTLAVLAGRVKKMLGVKQLEVAATGARTAKVTRVGLCAGAGGSLVQEAGPLDAFLTGEMRHHDVLAAVSRGTAVLLAGHTQTERPYLKQYRQKIMESGGKGVLWRISRTDVPPSALW